MEPSFKHFKQAIKTKEFWSYFRQTLIKSLPYFLMSAWVCAIFWLSPRLGRAEVAAMAFFLMCMLSWMVGIHEYGDKRAEEVLDSAKDLIKSYETMLAKDLETLKLVQSLQSKGATDGAAEILAALITANDEIVNATKRVNNKRDEEYRRAGLLNSKV